MSARVYIGNLPRDVREREIDDLFYKYGRIRDIDIKSGGRGTFAFVEFDDPRDADDAVRGRDGIDFDGGRIRVELAKSSGRRGGGRDRDRRYAAPSHSDFRVKITNLPRECSWQDVKDFCRKGECRQR